MRPPCSSPLLGRWSLNPGCLAVDQTTMRMPEVSHPSPTTAEAFRRILDERAIQPLFQPLIDLDTRHVLGYEALARGPMGSALESPAALFGAAWRAGRVAELDWACRAAAFTEAVRGRVAPPLTLFVNAEPVSLGVACPDDLRPAIELGEHRLRVVVEVTERAVAGDPARLLATVAQARRAGWGVALDDVGAAPASLAVLPFVRPDLIKLDMRLLQGRTTAEAAHIVNTVRAQAERTDAVVIAEGIETIKHAREAAAAGATIGQGFLFGHPAPLPSEMPPAPTEAQPVRVPGHQGGVHRGPRPRHAGRPGGRRPRRRPGRRRPAAVRVGPDRDRPPVRGRPGRQRPRRRRARRPAPL
jgi:EAL domain-containing protein (putative c-di-GMP-specific phosphodiesterase class I)